jgi:hypothetical protein
MSWRWKKDERKAEKGQKKGRAKMEIARREAIKIAGERPGAAVPERAQRKRRTAILLSAQPRKGLQKNDMLSHFPFNPTTQQRVLSPLFHTNSQRNIKKASKTPKPPACSLRVFV